MVCRAKRGVQNRSSGRSVLRRGAVVAAMLVVGLAGVRGWAAKPGSGGGTPPPPGTIYFRQGGPGLASHDVWRINGDGSGAGVELTTISGYRVFPSISRYGGDGHRWCLVSAWDPIKEELDLYATTDGAAYHQLTDCGYTDPVTWETGVVTRSLLRLMSDGASWSNDGWDQFISFPVLYAEFELGSDGQWSRTVFDRAIVQLPLSAGDLEQMTSPYVPVTAADPARLIPFVTLSSDIAPFEHIQSHHWSPDGTRIVYDLRDPTNTYDELWVADVSGGPVDAEDGSLLFSAGAQGAVFIDPPQWSHHANPADQRIAFNFFGALRTIRPDGSGFQTLTSDGNTNGGTSYWSPDNQFLVYRRTTQKGFKVTNSIVRIPSAGGAVVVLYTGQDPEVNKNLQGWCDD